MTEQQKQTKAEAGRKGGKIGGKIGGKRSRGGGRPKKYATDAERKAARRSQQRLWMQKKRQAVLLRQSADT